MPIQRITSGILANGAIVATDIADGSVTASKLADANVTSSKLASTLSISGNFLANNVTANTNLIVPAGSNTAPSIFPSGDTNTGIFFPAADTIAFAEGGAEAMRIDANGNVGIGTTSPAAPLQLATAGYFRLGDGTFYHTIRSGTGNESLDITANAGAGDAVSVSAMRFLTSAGTAGVTEKARVTGAGQFLVGKTADDDTSVGCNLTPVGLGVFVRSGGDCVRVNRTSSDGDLVTFKQDGTTEGTISVSGSTVSYNQFLGSHWAALTDWSKPDIKIGTILDSINELVIWKFAVIDVNGEQKKICYNGNAEVGTTVSVEYEGETYQGVVELEREREFTKAVKVKVNDTAASKAVYGVFVGWNNDTNGDGGTWNDMYVGAVGNYVIRMAAGQEPEIGDLIEADGNGCGVVQDDDIVRTKTVGKITSNIVQKTYEDGSFLVTCVLYSG